MYSTFSVLILLVLMTVLAAADEKASATKEEASVRHSSYRSQSAQCVHRAQIKGVCLLMGFKTPSAMLVFQGEKDKYGIPLMRRNSDFNFKLDSTNDLEFISFINVTNLKESGDEGFVTLTSGGVGHRNVSLLLESQRGEGYHFAIEILSNIYGQDPFMNVPAGLQQQAPPPRYEQIKEITQVESVPVKVEEGKKRHHHKNEQQAPFPLGL